MCPTSVGGRQRQKVSGGRDARRCKGPRSRAEQSRAQRPSSFARALARVKTSKLGTKIRPRIPDDKGVAWRAPAPPPASRVPRCSHAFPAEVCVLVLALAWAVSGLELEALESFRSRYSESPMLSLLLLSHTKHTYRYFATIPFFFTTILRPCPSCLRSSSSSSSSPLVSIATNHHKAKSIAPKAVTSSLPHPPIPTWWTRAETHCLITSSTETACVWHRLVTSPILPESTSRQESSPSGVSIGKLPQPKQEDLHDLSLSW